MPVRLIRRVVRWLFIGAALWNGLFLAGVGLWSMPRDATNPLLEHVLLLTACFLPLPGAVWCLLRPRAGARLILAGVAVYLMFCLTAVLEQVKRGEQLGWDFRPFYMFVIPSTVIAIVIRVTTKADETSCSRAGEGNT